MTLRLHKSKRWAMFQRKEKRSMPHKSLKISNLPQNLGVMSTIYLSRCRRKIVALLIVSNSSPVRNSSCRWTQKESRLHLSKWTSRRRFSKALKTTKERGSRRKIDVIFWAWSIQSFLSGILKRTKTGTVESLTCWAAHWIKNEKRSTNGTMTERKSYKRSMVQITSQEVVTTDHWQNLQS